MRRLGGLLASAVVAVGLVALVPSAASAAACTKGTGVTVVVDGNQLGGLSTTCVPGGGSSATSAFSSAGVSLRYASRMPGFVCRVNNQPTSDPCVNTSPSTAYWSLWWSKGDGTWTYSSLGVQSLSIPKGGWVAWSWQGQSATSAPSVTPQGPAAKPAPTKKPATGSSSTGASGATGTAEQKAKTQAQAEQEAAAEEKVEKAEKAAAAEKKAEAKASASASASASGSAAPESGDDTRATSATTDSAPPWSTIGGIAAVLVLLAAAGVLAWRRRSEA